MVARTFKKSKDGFVVLLVGVLVMCLFYSTLVFIAENSAEHFDDKSKQWIRDDGTPGYVPSPPITTHSPSLTFTLLHSPSPSFTSFTHSHSLGLTKTHTLAVNFRASLMGSGGVSLRLLQLAMVISIRLLRLEKVSGREGR